MSNTLIWILVSVVIPPQILMVGLNFAPKRFWRSLAARHRMAAHFLWGFSHILGPLSRVGEPPAWESLRR